MARVILPEMPERFNLEDAKRYGELTPLSDTKLDPLNPHATTCLFHSQLDNLKFNPEKDFVCMTGSQLTIALFLAALSVRYENMKLLMFDARNATYCERLYDPEAGLT